MEFIAETSANNLHLKSELISFRYHPKFIHIKMTDLRILDEASMICRKVSFIFLSVDYFQKFHAVFVLIRPF